MKTIRTLKKVQLKTPSYQPQIDLSEFQEDDGNEFEALRFCYYTSSGKFPNRPLMITEDSLIELLVKAFREKLFSDEGRKRLIDELSKILPSVKSAEDLFGRYQGEVSDGSFSEIKENYHEKLQ